MVHTMASMFLEGKVRELRFLAHTRSNVIHYLLKLRGKVVNRFFGYMREHRLDYALVLR